MTPRTEPAHQEARLLARAAGERADGTRAEVAIDALAAWAAEHRRRPAGAVRLVLVPNTTGERIGPDTQFAVPLLAAEDRPAPGLTPAVRRPAGG